MITEGYLINNNSEFEISNLHIVLKGCSLVTDDSRVSVTILDEKENVYFLLEGKRFAFEKMDEEKNCFGFLITRFEYDELIEGLEIFKSAIVRFDYFVQNVFFKIEKNMLGKYRYIFAEKDKKSPCLIAKWLCLQRVDLDDGYAIYRKDYSNN